MLPSLQDVLGQLAVLRGALPSVIIIVAVVTVIVGGSVWWFATTNADNLIAQKDAHIAMLQDQRTFVLSEPKTPDPPPSQPSTPFASLDQLKPRHIKGLTFRITDLVRANDGLIRDRIFEGCEVHGPAVIVLQGRTMMLANDIGIFGGTFESVLWPMKDGPHVGAVSIRDSQFIRCAFKDVGFGGGEDELRKWAAGVQPRPQPPWQR